MFFFFYKNWSRYSCMSNLVNLMTQYSTNTLIPINTSVISKYRFCLRNYNFVEIWLRARKCVDCPRVTWPICLEIDAHSSYVVSHFLNQQEHIITWRFSFKIRILWFSYIPCAISLLSYNLVWMQSWLRHMAAVDVRTSILCQGISIRHDNQIRNI